MCSEQAAGSRGCWTMEKQLLRKPLVTSQSFCLSFSCWKLNMWTQNANLSSQTPASFTEKKTFISFFFLLVKTQLNCCHFLTLLIPGIELHFSETAQSGCILSYNVTARTRCGWVTEAVSSSMPIIENVHNDRIRSEGTVVVWHKKVYFLTKW